MDPAQVALILGVCALGTWLSVRLVGPIATAFAKRFIEGRHLSTDDAELGELRQEVLDLHERVDFLERVLARSREESHPGGRLLPPESIEEEPRIPTPV